MSSATKITSVGENNICSESNIDKLIFQKENGVCHMAVCRVCLATNVKLFHMLEHKLSVQYALVTGFEINSEDRLPHMLCWECVGRLSSANRFIEKAHRSQWIISKKINCGVLITLDEIELIDKAQHKLQSSLSTKFHEVNDCDLYIDNVEADMHNTNNCNNSTSNNKEINTVLIEPYKIDSRFNVSNVMDISFDEGPKIKKYDINEVTENNYVFTYKDTETDTDNEYVIDIKKENKSESEDEMLQGVVHNMANESSDRVKYNAHNFSINIPDTDRPRDKQTEHPTTSACASNGNSYRAKKCGPFMCHQCNKSYSSKMGIRTHFQTHMNHLSCPYCDYSSHFKTNLQAHVNSKHTKKITFPCSYCDFKSLSRMSLRSHEKLKHFRTFVTCPHCDHKTHSRRNLKVHINSVHTKSIVFDCTYCDYRSPRKQNMDAHVNAVHTKSVSYDCTQCSFKTYYKRCLNIHVRKMHPS